MAGWSLSNEGAAAEASARRRATKPVGAWSIRYDEVLPARSPGRAFLAVRNLSSFYLWFVGTLLAWALVPVAVGMTPVLITSGSMQPAVSSGDVVVIDDDVEHPVEVGSVITFRDPGSPGRLVTHRVTDLHDDGTYETRGDANAAADSTPLPRDHVQGAARVLVPAVGLPALWLRSGEIALFALWMVVSIVALAGVIVPKRAGPAPQRQLSLPPPPRRRRRRPAWQPAAAVSLSSMTLLSALALSVAAFSAMTANAGDWSGDTLPVPPNLDGTVTCGSTSKDVDLTWDAVSSDSAADGYEVYRSTTSGGPYDDHRGTVQGVDSTTFSDSDLAIENETYYYVVRSFDDTSTWESDNSNEFEAPAC